MELVKNMFKKLDSAVINIEVYPFQKGYMFYAVRTDNDGTKKNTNSLWTRLHYNNLDEIVADLNNVNTRSEWIKNFEL